MRILTRLTPIEYIALLLFVSYGSLLMWPPDLVYLISAEGLQAEQQLLDERIRSARLEAARIRKEHLAERQRTLEAMRLTP